MLDSSVMAHTGTGLRPENRCVMARKKDGRRCRAAKVTLLDQDTGQYVRYKICLGHLMTFKHLHDAIEKRHGFHPAKASGGKGGRPRRPTAIEILRQKVEEEYGLDKFLQPIFDALEAHRPVVVGNGSAATLELVPDDAIRLKAMAEAMDRIYGKPKQTQEITGASGGPVAVEIPSDEQRAKDVAKMLAITGALGDVSVVDETVSNNGHSNGNGG